MHSLMVSKGNKPRNGLVKKCHCGSDFYVNPSRASSAYCSVPCRNTDTKQRVYLTCSVCSKTYFRYKSQVIHRGNSIACSKKCRGVLERGSRNSRWIYDRSKLKVRPNGNADHKEWRQKVFERDDYTCQMCKERGGYLEADHIKPWAFFPELRFLITNGRTLCRGCHNKTKIGPKRMRELYSPATTQSFSA